MRKLLDGLYLAAGALAGACVVAIFLIMVVGSAMREMGFRTGGTDDVVSWLTAAAAFLAMAHTFKHGDFVRVGLLLDQLGPPTRRAAEIAALLVGSVCCVYLALAGVRYVQEGMRVGEIANGLIAIPLWIPQLSFVAGTGLFALAMLDELVCVLAGAKPSYVTAQEDRHARGDFSSEV
jgi:TRAP-type C4-dicarboxylate transport system permease small subunit